MTLNAEDKLIRAKVQLQSDKPFFSFLVTYLKCQEDTTGQIPEHAGMGIDIKSNLIYKKDWVESLTEEQLMGVLCHEILHIVLQHLERWGGRDPQLCTVCDDLVINDILVTEHMVLPEGLVPSNHSFTFEGDNVTINNLNEKTSEQVYDELNKAFKKNKKESVDNANKKRFDEHKYSDGGGEGQPKDGKAGKSYGGTPSKAQLRKLKKQWKRVLAEAVTYAQQRGLLPAGMERLIEGLLESKISWRHKLYKYITNELPYDFTWSRPHKKSMSTGIYMPSIQKEKIEIVVAIDTSGSISQKDLTEFISEICTIAKSFNNIEMDLIVGDAELQNEYSITNGDESDFANLKLGGGGGTSHKFVVDFINEKKPMAKILICLTDGFSDIEQVFEELPGMCKTIIVMPSTNARPSKDLEEFGEIIILE